MKTYRPDPQSPATAAPQAGAAGPADSTHRRGTRPPLQANGSFWLLTAFTLACSIGLLRPPPRLPTLQPVADVPCPIPIEVPGHGVSCWSSAAAQQLGLSAGAVMPPGPPGERAAGPPTRMAPRRLLATQVLLDPETATAAELEALPDLGPHLAQRIVEARAQRAARGSPPLRTQEALLAISGLGKRRLQRLLPFLIPLP